MFCVPGPDGVHRSTLDVTAPPGAEPSVHHFLHADCRLGELQGVSRRHENYIVSANVLESLVAKWRYDDCRGGHRGGHDECMTKPDNRSSSAMTAAPHTHKHSLQP